MANPVRNGGFPEPISGEPQRLIRARHDACGTATRVRLPRVVPARAVRRVVCERCESPYDAGPVEEIALIDPARQAPAPAPGESRARRWGSAVLAAFAVAGILLLIRRDPGVPELP
jgi:hypothetical protein